MKNAISYYYNLNPESIHQQDSKYRFIADEKKYILCKYEGRIEELEEKYYLQQYLNIRKIYCHKITKNRFYQLITEIDMKKYVLIELIFNNRIIKIEDISYISNISVRDNKIKYINKNEWKYLWKKKVDYIEYQLNQIGKKYNVITEINDYFIGIAENCIELLENENIKNNNTAICHERINKKTSTDEFYNPLNFIIDNRTRDISEYLKKNLYDGQYDNKEFEEYIITNKLNSSEVKLLFIRLLYPSTYFDLYEQILEKKIKEKELLKKINNSQNFEKNIKQLYKDLKRMIDMPNIEWLKIKKY